MQMFTEIQSIIKKKAQKITEKIKNKAAPAIDLFDEFRENIKSNPVVPSDDYAKTPQKFNIEGRQIVEKKLIAEGAFGFIWLAEDANSKEQFALKRVICMTQDKIKSAVLQKSILQKLPESPYIVKYYGGIVFKHDENTVVITLMEFCPGGNLFDMLCKFEGKGTPEESIKNIAKSVLQGLSVLHGSGLAHRDIKIQNVLVGKDSKLKICDFGSCTKQVIDFSKVDKSEYESIKESIETFTTPMYRAPEIVDPYLKYKVSTKVDLWMLGCVLYTMCYFVHPFVESNAIGIASAVYRFPRCPQQTKYKVSQKMQDFIRNLLTPNPEFRPSAEKMLEIINRWDSLQVIPLNQQAKKIKKEHEEKEAQLKSFNKKVVNYEGDIPIEQLMKLHEKLKNNNQEFAEKPTVSFINEKESPKVSTKIKTQPATTTPSTNINFSQFDNISVNTKKQTKKQLNAPVVQNTKTPTANKNNVDVWSDVFSNSKPSTSQKVVLQKSSASQNFDEFNNIFNNVPPQKKVYNSVSICENSNEKKLANNDNFFEFFQVSTGSSNKNIQEKSNSKKQIKQVNLLDL